MDRSRVPHLRAPSRAAPGDGPKGQSFGDAEVLRASEWLAREPADPAAIVLGVPFSGGSISRARTDLGPAAVRAALGRFTVWSSDAEVSVESLAVLDAGDVEPAEGVEETQRRVEESIRALPAVPLVVLGGDNSITVGAARGARATALLTFDAHHDCRDPARGATNGSPVRQLIEGGLAGAVQIGIHGFANAEIHARWAREHGVEWFTARAVQDEGIDHVLEQVLERFLREADARLWVDVDLDVLDRAFAPGAPAAIPGGLRPADLERAAFLLGRESAVAGLDIVELDPTADVADATARAACAVMLAFLAGVASRR